MHLTFCWWRWGGMFPDMALQSLVRLFALREVTSCGAFVFPPFPPRRSDTTKSDSQFGCVASAAALQAQRLKYFGCGTSAATARTQNAIHMQLLRFKKMSLALVTADASPQPTNIVATPLHYFSSRCDATKSAVRIGSPFAPACAKGAGDRGPTKAPLGKTSAQCKFTPPPKQTPKAQSTKHKAQSTKHTKS